MNTFNENTIYNDVIEVRYKGLYGEISETHLRERFSSGSAAGYLVQDYIADVFGDLNPTQGQLGFDVVSQQGRKYEVRTVSKDGLHFEPSSCRGVGRKYTEEALLQKLNQIDGYIVCDTRKFPNITYRFLSSEVIRRGSLKKNGVPTKMLTPKQIEEKGIFENLEFAPAVAVLVY